MSTRHSIDFCPVCGGGLCSIRYFDRVEHSDQLSKAEIVSTAPSQPHGLIICDECEAIWLDPDLTQAPIYTDAENPTSPITGQAIWGHESHWATQDEIKALGWSKETNHQLDITVEP